MVNSSVSFDFRKHTHTTNFYFIYSKHTHKQSFLHQRVINKTVSYKQDVPDFVDAAGERKRVSLLKFPKEFCCELNRP